MKNRKRIVVAFMLVAVLLLGVGYAALQSELTINGTATFSEEAASDAFQKEVIFTVTSMIGSTGTAVGTTGSPLKDTAGGRGTTAATFEVLTLMNQGEKADYHFQVTNNSEVDVQLTLPAALAGTGTGTAYYTVTIKYQKAGSDVTSGTATLAPTEALDMYVTVTLSTPPIQSVTASYSIEFPVVAVEAP